MTLEEFKNLSEEQFNNFKDEFEDEFEELMGQAISEATEKYHDRVFEAGCVFFILNDDGILEISNDSDGGPRGGCLEIVCGPTLDEIDEIDDLMSEYDFDENLFSDICDYPEEEDWDSEYIADYADEDDEDLTEKVNIVLELQEAVNEETIPFASVNDIFRVLKKYDLDSDTLYYEWEGEYVNLYDNIEYCGECRGEYDDIDDYEWLKMLSHLEDFEVSVNNTEG